MQKTLAYFDKKLFTGNKQCLFHLTEEVISISEKKLVNVAEGTILDNGDQFTWNKKNNYKLDRLSEN